MNRSGELTFEVSYDFVTQTTKATFYIPDREIMVHGSGYNPKMLALKYLHYHLSAFIKAQEDGLICYPLED